MSKITVIGLGPMGAALAKCLLEAGYTVTVWNRTATKAEPLIKDGAVLADSVGTAIEASPVVISCVGSHRDTLSLYQPYSELILDRKLIELTTGDAEEAIELGNFVIGQGGNLIIGAIAAYPSGIGRAETSIMAAGKLKTWQDCETIIMTLAPASSYIGEKIESVAAMFAGHFLSRLGFMFGMIYGAVTAEKAGVSLEDYFRQMPITLEQADRYRETARDTICSGDFSNRGAPLTVYEAAIKDMTSTFETLEVSSELSKWMLEKVQHGINAGQGDEELPSLIKQFRKQIEGS